MTFEVDFIMKTPIASSTYSLWTYRVTGGGVPGITVGQRIALAFPADLDIQNPQQFPSVPDLNGMFLQLDAGSTRQYVGRVVTAPGPQTLALVAPADSALAEVLLATRATGEPWVATPFSTSNEIMPNIVQTLTAPVVASSAQPAHHGRPVTDFVGALPYASEMFGIYQPLAGWLGQQSTARVLAAQAGPSAAGAGTGTSASGTPSVSPEAFTGTAARNLTAPLWRDLLATPYLGSAFSSLATTTTTAAET